MIAVVLALVGLVEFVLRLTVVIVAAVTLLGLMLLLDDPDLFSELLTPVCWRLLETRIGGGRRG